MAADAWVLYNKAIEYIGDGTHDLDTHTFKIALFTSTYVPALTDTSYAALSGELAGSFGYTTGGETLAGVTWTEAAGVVTFDATNPSWIASGGDLVFRYAVIYNSTDAGTALLCYSLLDNTPADITVTDGSQYVIQFNALGIFQAAAV